MNTNTNEFEKYKHLGLFRQMLRMGFPLMIAQAMNILYNLADRFYILNLTDENIPNLGELAFSGLSICFPVILIISAFSGLIGGGGVPIAAIKLGEKNVPYAEKVLKHCFLICVFLALIITAIVITFGKNILYAFGATSENITYAYEYLFYYSLGTVFVLTTLTVNPFITTQGKSKVAMFTLVLGAVINIAFDPLFIFVFNLGVKGAAIATVFSQIVACVFALLYITNKKRFLRLKIPNLKLDLNIILSILALGISPFIFQSTEALVQITLYSGMKRYGGDLISSYQAAMGFIILVNQIIIHPVIGFNQGTQALMGYNYGAKNYKTVRQIMNRSFIFLTIIFSTMCILVMLFSPNMSHIFTSNEATLSIATRGLRIYWMSMWLLGFLFTIQTSFLAMRISKTSAIIALSRKVFLLVPLAIILPYFIGIDGIFFAAPIADFLSVMLAITLMATKKNKLLPKNA